MCRAVEDGKEGRKEGEERELDIAHPEICLGALEHHLKVNTCKAGSKAGSGDRAKALERAHDMDVQWGGVMRTSYANLPHASI